MFRCVDCGRESMHRFEFRVEDGYYVCYDDCAPPLDEEDIIEMDLYADD